MACNNRGNERVTGQGIEMPKTVYGDDVVTCKPSEITLWSLFIGFYRMYADFG